MENVFKSHDITEIIHLAAYKAVGESVEKPIMYYQNNLTMLKALYFHQVQQYMEIQKKYQQKKQQKDHLQTHMVEQNLWQNKY